MYLSKQNDNRTALPFQGSPIHRENEMRNKRKIKRGEIYYVDCGSTIGSEQSGIRPVVIIQNDKGNRYSPTTIAALVTSKKKGRLSVHVRIRHSGLPKESYVLLEQIRTISTDRLERYVGTLSRADMHRIEKALKISLALT